MFKSVELEFSSAGIAKGSVSQHNLSVQGAPLKSDGQVTMTLYLR